MQHILHFITNERLAELHTALNRAANTWEDAPAWVIDLCDALHAGQVTAQDHAGSVKAAIKTLSRLGYTHRGGEEWAPPLGKAPSFELHPYQQEAMASLASVPTKITMADEVDDIVDPSFDYLPEWAERKIALGEDGYRCLHAQLMTRDGRRSGNAVIAEFGADTEAANAVVRTDMGNEMVLNQMELEELFYPPVYIMKADCVGKRLAKSHGEPNPTKALYTVGYNAEGERVTWCVRSSEDPCKDQSVMNTALELVQAITLRNVPITPEVLYKRLVGVEYTAHPADDPLDMPLPCDITVGHGTHGKGTKLRSLVNRMQRLYAEAQGSYRFEMTLRLLAMKVAKRHVIVHKPDSVPMNREVFDVYCNDLYHEHLAETRAAIRGNQL